MKLTLLADFWKEVEHYREIGIENHPSKKQKKIIDFTDPDPDPDPGLNTISNYSFRD